MAYTSQTRAPIQSAFNSRADGILAALRIRFDRWNLYRRTLNEMQALSNRELADLGLHRSELRRVAWQAVYDN